MIQGADDEEDDHEDERSFGNSDAKKADQADHCQVAPNKSMLQGTGVDASFTVDGSRVNVQEVVPESKVEKREANCGEP